MESKGQFRCIHCGDRFDLSKEEMELYSEGYYATEPDTCDECMDMINHSSYDISDMHSDADPGL